MKKIIFILAVVLLLANTPSKLMAQENDPWPEKMPAISFIAAAPISINGSVSYEHLKFTGSFFHGPLIGISVMIFDGVTWGPHLAYNLMFGKGRHHLELKGGIVVPVDPDVTYVPFMPLGSIGYRAQAPGSKTYFKTSLSSGGIGIGFGILLN